MRQPQLTRAYIVRVQVTAQGRRITVQDLGTREVHEFASWLELSRYMHLKENRENLFQAQTEI